MYEPTLVEAPAPVAEHQRPVKLVVSSPDGALLATADVDRNLKVWQEGKCLFELNFRHPHDKFRALDSINAMVFDSKGEFLFLCSAESVHGVNARSGEIVWMSESAPTWGFLITSPLSLSMSSARQLAVGNSDGYVDLYAFNSGAISKVGRWYDNDGPVNLAFMRDGQRILGTDHQSLCTWEAGTGVKLSRYVPGERVKVVAASTYEDVVAFRTLREVQLFTGNGDWMATGKVDPGLPTLAFSPVASLLAVSDAWGVTVCDYNFQPLERFEMPGIIPLSVAFHPSGNSVLAGYSDGSVRAWSIGGATA